VAGLTSDLGQELSFLGKLCSISWGLVLLVFIAAACGIAELYSAADGDMQPWAATQMVRFGIALIPMIGAALLGIRHWYRAAYWMYAIALALVVAVDLRGFVGMGARRWIDLGLIQLQPSSLMNITLVMALARYFHARSDEDIACLRYLIPPALMVVIPAALVLKQPDLGTAVMLLITGAALFFMAGVRWSYGGDKELRQY